jgi:hypothetical protein
LYAALALLLGVLVTRLDYAWVQLSNSGSEQVTPKGDGGGGNAPSPGEAGAAGSSQKVKVWQGVFVVLLAGLLFVGIARILGWW